jgi:hypothetical protein
MHRFFLTRVLFHSWIIWYTFSIYEGYYWVLISISYPLHIHWFRGWLKQQRRKRGMQNKEEGKGQKVAGLAQDKKEL